MHADSKVCDVRRGRRVSVPIMYTLMSTLLELNYNILFKVIDLYLGDKKIWINSDFELAAINGMLTNKPLMESLEEVIIFIG